MNRMKSGLVAFSLAATVTLYALAADKKEPEPTPEPSPEPTQVPRPEDLNIKKRSASDDLLAREWLRISLLKADDVPGLKQVPEFADEALRNRINASFGFPAVMTMREPPLTPPVWWSADKQGAKALTLGPTRSFNRPELSIEVPMLRLREVPYIVGDSTFVRTLNEMIRLWTLGRTQEAIALRNKLQADKKTLPRGTLERTTVAILSGFLDLQAAAELKMPLERFGPAQGSFWDAFGSTELKVYLPDSDKGVDDNLFRAALAEPAVFSDEGIYPPRLTPPKLAPRSIEMIRFARALALPAIYNVAALGAKAKNWTRVFEASQKFEEVYNSLDKRFVAQKSTELNFTTPPGVKSTHPIMMWPRTAHQLKSIVQMLRVNGQFIAEDPLMALKESARVILQSDVPAFKVIGFAQAGNVYSDLGYPNFARRFHGFSEAFADAEWYQQNPYFLLVGAENAFWSGELALAKQAFSKFLLSAGDKLFGPWARLRLAEIAHLTEGLDKATILYEQILRHQEKHPAGLIARRRLFCITAPQTGAKARYIEYQALKDKFSSMDEAEQEQVRACHLNGLVDDAGAMAQNTMKSLPDDAAVQLGLLDEFSKKYPQSKYLRFLEERKTTLQTALGTYALAFKQCGDALAFFTANEKKIAVLKKNGGKFLPLLKWTNEEQARLLKCAALFAKKDVLEKLSPQLFKSTARQTSGKDRAQARAGETADALVTRLALEMTLTPTDKRAEALFLALRRGGEEDLWSLVRALESKQSQSIDDDKFWKYLAAVRVMQWDLEQPEKKKQNLRRSMRFEVLRQPEQTLKRKELCERFLLETSSLSTREWDSFVLAMPTERWLELLKTAPAGSTSCELTAAALALSTAQSQPSLARDRHVLWPWLQSQGARKEQEAWLALGTRWASERSVSKQEVEELFKTLEKEADTPSVKQAARAWLESKKPGGLW